MPKEELDREDAPFEIPKFDEDEFVRKELISFRTTVVMFVFAILTSLGTFALWRFTGLRFVGLFIIAMALGILLRYAFRAAKIDVSHWGRKEWIGTFFLYFFFWLGFTLLLTNPPISDNAPPIIEAYATPPAQGVGHPVELAAYVADNSGIDKDRLVFCLMKSSSPPATFADLSPDEQSSCRLSWNQIKNAEVWSYTWVPTEEGSYVFYVSAFDDRGKPSDFRGYVNVTNPFPVIDPGPGTSFTSLSQSLIVRPDPSLNLVSVQYEIDGGRRHNMTAPTNERPNYWTTGPTFPGWRTGANNVTIVAWEQPRYLHGYTLLGGTARHAAATRTYTVDADYPDLGRDTEPKPKINAPPNLASSPGFDGLLLPALGLATATQLLRARRHA